MRHRLLLYSLLTQLIIWLSRLRDKVMEGDWTQVRHDRTYLASTNGERWTCCDCGLEHATYPLFGEHPRDPAFRFVPVRPVGYDYGLRHGAGEPQRSFDARNIDPHTGRPWDK